MNMEIENSLVYIDEYGLLGSNFYWHKHDSKGITKEEILAVGLENDRVQVHKEIIQPLVTVDKKLRPGGYRLYIKEGYRSAALYELVYRKRIEKFGKEETDRLINMKDMPHATGKSVDVAVFDIEGKSEIFMRQANDGTNALFYGFYQDKTDAQSVSYQQLQDRIKNLMEDNGFGLGTKKEYFHFDYIQ